MENLTPVVSQARKVGMRVLVTGGAVLNVDKLTYAANLASLPAIEGDPRYAFRRADICDRFGMSQIIAGFSPHGVLHLGAESHVDRSDSSCVTEYMRDEWV